MKNKIIITVVIILWAYLAGLHAKEHRALWVLPWNITTAQQIDEIIEDAIINNQTEILAEIRYRADALYIPNKFNTTYNNPEPRSYVLKNDDFDPLDYMLSKAHANGLKVQAWICVLNVTPTEKSRLLSNYIYLNHPEWIMKDANGNRMNGSKYMGNFIDPGVMEVRNYLMNIILDIVSNYPELDGIHLDYIRYPGRNYGHSRESLTRFASEHETTKISWNDWRKKQITDFIIELRTRTNIIRPNLLITAAVIANIHEAEYDYAQDWVYWLNNGIIDRAYPMAYAKDYSVFERILNRIGESVDKEKVVIGLRAWQENFPRIDYSVDRIIEKARLVRSHDFSGIALFSYDGIKKTGYFHQLTAALFDWLDIDFDQHDEDDFISRLTSSSRWYVKADSMIFLSNSPKTLKIELYDVPEISNNNSTVQASCDNISVSKDKFYITFYFSKEKKWSWEISDLNDILLHYKTKIYPKGYYTEELVVLSEEQAIFNPGIYKLTIKDAKNKIIFIRKFMVN